MSQPDPVSEVVLLFGSATLVLWGEEVAQEAGLPVEVVPAPPGTAGMCGLALRISRAHLPALEDHLKAEGIPYRVHG